VHGQRRVMGRLLWLSFETVVVLTEQCRQSGEGNMKFVQLLTRLREGKCTDEDFDMLNSRRIDRCDPQMLAAQDWTNIPVIVTNNATKDVLNSFAAVKFTDATNQDLHWYCAEDIYKSVVVADQGSSPISVVLDLERWVRCWVKFRWYWECRYMCCITSTWSMGL